MVFIELVHNLTVVTPIDIPSENINCRVEL